ncbi:unnamed protein product [marine sediment metagenome]|uniref:Uncharacterized protein n=1 Tax=marine sediment metagenome TaxID=412755 RepID=X0SB78_9ZZZZ
MNKKHEANCPLCKHPEIAEIERFYGDWYTQKELIDMFELAGEGRTYENESAAYRGILRHMTAKRTPLDRRAKNCLGLLRCFARNGERVMSQVEPITLLTVGQKAASKLAEIEHGLKHHVDGNFTMQQFANVPTEALEQKAIDLVVSIPGAREALKVRLLETPLAEEEERDGDPEIVPVPIPPTKAEGDWEQE